jgi:hypothetical protein
MSSQSEPTIQNQPLMLYAIARHPLADLHILGVKNQPVRWIQLPRFGIYASDIDLLSIRPQRTYLEQFHKVISQLMSASSILPMTFGSLVTSETELLQNLKQLEPSILEKIDSIENSIEIGLKFVVPEQSIYEFIAERNQDIRRVRDFYKERPEELTQEKRIEVGTLIEKSLITYRSATERNLQTFMQGIFKDVRVATGKNQNELLEFSFLIPKERQKDFEDRVRAFAAQLPDDAAVKLIISGPLAPYNFARLQSA